MYPAHDIALRDVEESNGTKRASQRHALDVHIRSIYLEDVTGTIASVKDGAFLRSASNDNRILSCAGAPEKDRSYRVHAIGELNNVTRLCRAQSGIQSGDAVH